MLPEKPELVPAMEVTVPSGETTFDCRLAVRVLLPEPLRVTEPGPNELAVPLARLFGLPLMLHVTFSAWVPGEDAVTDGLEQETMVRTGTTRVMVALAVPESASAVFRNAAIPANARVVIASNALLFIFIFLITRTFHAATRLAPVRRAPHQAASFLPLMF